MNARKLSRRQAAALVALPMVWCSVQAQTDATRRPTPAQTEGPFYPESLPSDTDFDLLHNGPLTYTRGEPAWVDGSVTDLQARPIPGAVVEIWQCDAAGHYHHPRDGGRADPAFQGFGRVEVDAGGDYRFRTIRPVAYSGRAPHIHFKVKLGTRELLTTQLYASGDPRNERDGIWRRLSSDERAAVTVPFQPGAEGLRAVFPIVVAA